MGPARLAQKTSRPRLFGVAIMVVVAMGDVREHLHLRIFGKRPVFCFLRRLR